MFSKLITSITANQSFLVSVLVVFSRNQVDQFWISLYRNCCHVWISRIPFSVEQSNEIQKLAWKNIKNWNGMKFQKPKNIVHWLKHINNIILCEKQNFGSFQGKYSKILRIWKEKQEQNFKINRDLIGNFLSYWYIFFITCKVSLENVN